MENKLKVQSTNFTKVALVSGAALAVFAGASMLQHQGVVSNAVSVLGVPKAHALGTGSIEWNKEGIQQNNSFLINVPNGSVGGKTSWGIAGQTKIMNANGSAPATSTGNNTDSFGYTWGVANKPRTPQPVYSLNPGRQYRLTNVGKTTTGQGFDILITVKGTAGDTGLGKGISFVDSAQLGSGTDPFHSIALLVSGVHETNLHVDYVKSGSNDKINITSGTYWSDIDIHQGVNENQSNAHVIFGGVDDNNSNKMAVDGKTVYSTTEKDIDGMNNPNQGAYIGIGSGTGFDVHYYNPYRGGQNSWITDTDVKDFLYFRYDLFGRYDNLEFPVPLTNPKKTVTDMDEKQGTKNTVGIKERKQQYDISIDTGQGVLQKLEMNDTLPQGFKTDTGRIKVHNKDGKDITGLFDVKLDGQKVNVTAKSGSLTSQDLQRTTITVGIDGDLTSEWGPADLKNNAVWNNGQDHPTGDVHSYMPSKPEAQKEVSVDGGKTYNKADTPQNASQLNDVNNEYIWKNTFKLSNHTNFNKITFTDHFEKVQALDKSKVHVYDWTGKDVTGNGVVSTKDNGDKTDIIWTANTDYVNQVNKEFGRDSDKVPGFTYTVAGDLSNATNEALAKYKTDNAIVIPNQSTVTEGDVSGELSVDTNKSHVRVPSKIINPKKTVTDLDEKEGPKNTVGIKERKQSYNVSVDTTVGSIISKLSMNDNLPDGFKTDASRIKVHNSAGKDLTGLFDIKVDGQKVSINIKDNQRTNSDIFGTTITVNIAGDLSKEWGAMDLVNDAVWNDGKDHPTGKVHSYMPSKPEAHKQVSVDDGKTYNDADTPAKAQQIGSTESMYTWKNDFKLSNHTVFNKVQFVDHLENVQTADAKNIHVLDWNGKDVTAQGKITQAQVNGKNDVAWTANADYVAEINKEFGRDSDKVPTFSYTIKTTLANAKTADLAKFADKGIGGIIIPNQTTMIEGDASGRVNTDTNKSHVKTVPELKNPKKTVTDMDESKGDQNTVGIKERKQHYDVSVDVNGGGFIGKLEMSDKLPDGFVGDQGSVKITNKAGKDITNLFDISLKGQNLHVSIKDKQKSSPDIFATTINVGFDGKLTKDWGPMTIQNDAIWNDGKDHPTGKVTSHMPNKPTSNKQVSVDNEKTYKDAETPAKASEIEKTTSAYTWKNTFQLSNRSVFTNVKFTDHMEIGQTINNGNIHVYDWNGKDVTAQGKISQASANGKNDVTWSANANYVAEINKAFGRSSDKMPSFTYTIKTDLSKATPAQLSKYADKDTHSIIIPNKTTLTETDGSGDVSVDTNLSHIKHIAKLDNPKKTVTDMDEKKGDKNTVSLKERQQHYDVSIDVSNGGYIDTLRMVDTLPAGFKTDLKDVKITNKAGKDITNLFNMSLVGQKLTVNIKDAHKNNPDILNTNINVGIDGKLTKDWGPMDLVNDAVWTDDKDHPTTKVHSHMPSKPSAKKQVSVDGGKTFVDAISPAAAAALKDRPQEYTWKNSFTLSNHAIFNKVQFVDHLESLQAVDNSKIHVLDWNGNDITKNGAISTKNSGDKTDVIWTANSDYVAAINKSFGRDSDKKPTFTYNITTNIKNATDKQESKYWDEKSKSTIIPNQTTLIEGDNSGDVNTDTNKSHVKTPTPTAPTAKKQVAKDGTNPISETGWNASLQLSNHDQNYSYRTTFNLSKNYNFDGGNLVLTDHFKNLQSFKSVKIIDAQGKDISTKFDIKQTKKDAKTDIVATVKGASANDFDDKGATIYMVIDGATLEGATGVQELNYQEPHTKEAGATADEKDYVTDPFKEGITIPNISALDELSSKPGNSYHKDTNHTYVNFAVDPSIAKYVEDDNDSDSIIDPDLATDANESADNKEE